MRFLAALLAASFFVSPLAAAPVPTAELVRQVDIAHQGFTLANGLRVIVHTDRKTPVVAVSVWYHIGSKDEPKGKTGFAHLFEHLMFGGSENVADWDKLLEDVGQTEANGTTWYDRTNYFQNVPTPALETTLFAESDRMGYLLGAVSQTKLDIQRGVVQNEKRQGDNQPYGLVDYALWDAMFPEGHPYRHSTIGSMTDLDNASLEDTRNWFRANYGPNNAVLVLAGDVDVATARPLVEKYFGAIARGPEVRRLAVDVPKRTTTTRLTMTDAVANPRLYRNFVLPSRFDKATPIVDVAATILAGGASSRLYADLVRDKQLAVSVRGGVQAFEKVSVAQFEIDVKPGVDPGVVEARVDALFAKFLKDGPTADEVQRVATRAVSGTIRGLEAVGGFGGKAVTLAEGEVYAGDPDYYKVELARYAAATPASVKAAANAWLSRGDVRLTVVAGKRTDDDAARVLPVAAPATAAVAPVKGTRTPPPPITTTPELVFPAVERATLSNGVPVTLARRTTVPVVRMTASFDAGVAADDRAKPGLQGMMMALLDEGTPTRTGVQIAEEGERLGAGIGASAGLDRTRVSLDALKPNLADSIALFADVVRNPTFVPAEIERVRGQALTGIAQEMQDPSTLAARLLTPILYGPTHPYGIPGTGSGTPEGVKAVTRDALLAYHQRWMRPDNLQLFVVGDTTMAELLPLLEAKFGDWRPDAAPRGVKAFPAAETTPKARIILVDRPGSPQSTIRAGLLLPVTGRDDPFVLRAANDLIGGQFSARLNADLRELKGWSYGVGSRVGDAAGQLAFTVNAPVQTDRTGDSIAAIIADFDLLKGSRPIDAVELTKVVNSNVRSLPGDFESGGGVLAALERNALLGRPDDYYTNLPQRYRALTTADLNRAAAGIDPRRLTWVVVGDRKLVEPQLAKLGLPVEVR